MEVFPQARVPRDHDERRELLESIPKSKAILAPLDDVFFGEERIWPYFRKYVDAHPPEFFLDVPASDTRPDK
jgi:hypothetical protein